MTTHPGARQCTAAARAHRGTECKAPPTGRRRAAAGLRSHLPPWQAAAARRGSPHLAIEAHPAAVYRQASSLLSDNRSTISETDPETEEPEPPPAWQKADRQGQR